MSKEVAGIPLSRLEVPIWVALKSYQDIANGKLIFDAAKACKLVPTPEKANSARSATEIILNDSYGRQQVMSKLYVIAFKPGDGTGDTSTYKRGELEVSSDYPDEDKIIPRSKSGVKEEAHLTVVSHRIDDPHADPELFKGRFDLLGVEGDDIKGKKIVKIAELGNPRDAKVDLPNVNYTVYGEPDKRFGDPHAVYSSLPDQLQVCAFIAITNEVKIQLFLQHQLPNYYESPLRRLLNSSIPRA